MIIKISRKSLKVEGGWNHPFEGGKSNFKDYLQQSKMTREKNHNLKKLTNVNKPG
jgi:hypothetical protein